MKKLSLYLMIYTASLKGGCVISRTQGHYYKVAHQWTQEKRTPHQTRLTDEEQRRLEQDFLRHVIIR